MVAILPFIEQQNLKNTIPHGISVNDVGETLFQLPRMFRCPRTMLDGHSAQSLWPGHYVFVPASRRESFLVFDAPVDLNVPWLTGPEMMYDAIIQDQGPHSDGFHFARGFQQGVGLLLHGQEVPLIEKKAWHFALTGVTIGQGTPVGEATTTIPCTGAVLAAVFNWKINLPGSVTGNVRHQACS